ncbi:NmrA family NAD(P)-binding protein [Chitinophaga niabensis]|uniref:Uncharacterized conserved protein YbjT, contains NAD(P)-binding and DUF2867 domains n=1 Tax=Chitinophaga niabensis TaxID=536979 RepID=A0A1N6J003_9BACT|nr:NAD(P)H-binding protein [Chitinophaga niabensis]SIO37585.1 Uncharacterized conserved protein YbjT, contains NAD(P)-binding and DUF2867 domains [Chitinophaga niabensis]
MSKILVTGASGLSGSIIIKELSRQNIPVRALVRSKAKAGELSKYANVEVHIGDLLFPETYRDALKGIDKTLLISSALDKMVETQQAFIDTARQVGVPHIIKYSGAESGIGFNAQNFKGTKDHENIEDYLVDSGLAWTLLRPSQFMQMYLPASPTGVNIDKNALILPNGNAKLSPVDIEDVAKVCVQLLTTEGHSRKIYEMTGPDAMDMNEASVIISRATGRHITYRPVALNDYVDNMKGKVPGERLKILTQLAKERSKCIDSHVKLGTHKLFGVRPTNFAEFIYKNLDAFAKY